MLDINKAERTMRRNGRRMTPQRRAVLEALSVATEHPRVEDIANQVQRQVPGIALSTIYSIVHELASLDLVIEFPEKDGIHVDPRVETHAHLYCNSCGRIIDIPMDSDVVERLRDDVRHVGGETQHLAVTMSGLCPDCRNKS
jgi:Fe2+ or Zn2+ uptake regulation protein